jgi:hypothetical protein
MERAADRSVKEKDCREAMEAAADVSVINGVVALGQTPTPSTGLPRPEASKPNPTMAKVGTKVVAQLPSSARPTRDLPKANGKKAEQSPLVR